MRKYLVLIGLALLFSLPSKAQTIIDLTTGTDIVGEIDPIWEVQYPATIGYWPLTISTGLIEFSPGSVFNSYSQDPCGKWVSPFVNPGTNNIVKGPSLTGIFTYKAEIYVDHCEVYSASLHFSTMLADNTLPDVRINGTSYPPPAGITFLAPGSMSLPVSLTPGVNIVEVDVDNSESFTALQLCGHLEVYGGPPCYPVDLNCCEAPIGQILSWSEVEDAVSYEIEFNWNDPDCCDYEGPLPIVTIVNSDDNIYLYELDSGTSNCFSWRVRTVYADGTKSEYSEKICSCTPICDAPTKLTCTTANKHKFNWDDVAGASFYEIMITYNDPLCCNNDDPVSTIGYSTLSNSIQLPLIDGCFSWKVRTHCTNGVQSEWSEIECGCGKSTPIIDSSSKIETRRSTYTADIKTKIIPNPASQQVEITIMGDDDSHPIQNATLTITDISGQQIYTSKISMHKPKRVNVSDLDSGLYFLHVIHKGEIISADKLIVQ